MAKKRVFISFRAEDRSKVNGLRLLNANDSFDIEFYDESVRKEIQSQNNDYVRRKIREKINRTSLTLCMVSAETHTSEWVDWELEESYAKTHTVIFMGFKDGPDKLILPKQGREHNAVWWLWDHNKLDDLIAAAP